MAINYDDIGSRIKKFRISQKLSQEKLAEISNLSIAHISHIETGNTKLSLQAIVSISNALSVSVDSLLCDSVVQSKEIYFNEFSEQMEDCNIREIRIILEIIKASKVAIRKYL